MVFFLIFQEQIAMLAHKLGRNVTLDEGNLLRKLLTKKGTGKGQEKQKGGKGNPKANHENIPT